MGRYESVIFLNRPKPVNRNSRPWQLQLWSLQPDITHNHCREGRWKDPHGLRRTKFAVLRKASETLTRKSGSSSDDFTLETPYRTASGASTHTREQRKQAGQPGHFTTFQGLHGTGASLWEGLCRPHPLPPRSLSPAVPPRITGSITAVSAQTVLRECSHRSKSTASFRSSEGGALSSYPRDSS